MVEIKIMVEGGSEDKNAGGNTASLRQAFHRIFHELLGEEVSIEIEPEGGYRSASKQFIKNSHSDTFLFVDLDDERTNIINWFHKVETEISQCFPENKRTKTFFMIQEMEAWILKQPDAIEEWGKKYNYIRDMNKRIANHPSIVEKNIEDIPKPSLVLKSLIQDVFAKTVRARYGKLKTAPNLLDCLDVEKLKSNDSEIDRFYQYVKGNLIKERIVPDNRH